MAFNNITARGDVPTREDTLDVVMDGLENNSVARSRFRQATMGKAQSRFPVLASLPMAYWVNGDTGLKQTTEMAWTNKFINVEELAVIVPVPQNVVDDSDFDIWAEARPKVAQAIDRTLDSTIFFGDGAPASFPTAIVPAAISAGNVATLGTATAAEGGFYGDLDNLQEAIEDDGFTADSMVASRAVKSKFRRARNSQGDRLDRDRVNSDFTEFDGMPVDYTMDGLWPAATASPDGGTTPGEAGTLAVIGDFRRQFILGIRKDVTYEVFREGVIQDQTGAIVYNLLQQDMVALRVTFRAGWQVANTINYQKTDDAQRYPAAVLRSPALA